MQHRDSLEEGSEYGSHSCTETQLEVSSWLGSTHTQGYTADLPDSPLKNEGPDYTE